MTNDLAGLPAARRKQLNDELQRSERLLYVGRPSAFAAFTACLVTLVFATFWCSITFPMAFFAWADIFGIAPKIKGTPPTGGMKWFIAIFIIPFVAVGLGLLLSVPYAVLRSLATVHAVTSNRLLTLIGGRWPSVTSYPATSIGMVTRHDHRHGRGRLHFAYGANRDSDGDIAALTADWHGIPDVKRAETAVLEAVRRGKQEG